jgi:hypothetical protein
MCDEFEWEYMQYRAEEARKAMRKAEEALKKPRPAVPGGAAETPPKQLEPLPV